MKRVTTTLVVLLITMFMFVGVTSSTPYDAWYDFDDDGDIDIYDIVDIAGRYGTTGTPINKTELLLELEARVDALNATLITLQEQIGQFGAVKVLVGSAADTTNAVTGRVTVWYNASHTSQFTNPPTIFATAYDPTNGNSKIGEVFSAGLAEFVVTIKESVGGALFLDQPINVAWIAIGTENTSTTRAYASTFTDSTYASGNVYVSYPVDSFTATPGLSVTAQFNSGGIAQMGYVTVSSHTKDGFTLNVKDGSGANWSGNVQISIVAIQE
jgi:hypothetical protein